MTDLDDALSAMPLTHLMCRDYGHSWSPHTASRLPKQAGYEQILRCQRCATLRRRVLDRDGSVVTSRYDYAEHYRIAGLGHLSGSDRGAVRVASVQATLNIRLAS